ncbi:MAG TPA: twin-arginine translocase TatA/TatE family subunit [Polyangia bacterium]|jgi:TatA/E family protein of Tat protein translocase
MFGMGTGELLLILLIALLVFGPKKLPDLAKGLGKAIREFRRASTDLQEQIAVDRELGDAVREVQAAASGMPSPAELNAAHRPMDPATVPAPAPALAVAAAPTETVTAKPAPTVAAPPPARPGAPERPAPTPVAAAAKPAAPPAAPTPAGKPS